MPACACHFERRRTRLKLLKSTFNAENFICRLSGSISSHSSAIYSYAVCCSPNHEKFTKIPNLGVQGLSRSSVLIKIKCPWPVLVMISNMCVPIFNRFYTRKANGVKITSFKKGTPLLAFSFERIFSPRGMKFRHDKLKSLGNSKWRFRDFSLRRFDTIQQCDGQTDIGPGHG